MYTNIPQDILKNSSKVAIISGAGQGIGAEIARRFINQGYFVAFIDFNEVTGRQQERELGPLSKFYHCDLSNQSQIEFLATCLLKDFPTIDVLIHNAKSPAKERNILLNLESEWDTSIKVMLKHPLLLNQLLIPAFKGSDNASILYIGSTNAHFISHQPLSYHVIKGALAQTIRYLACQYASDNIRVNLLHPGIVEVPGRTRKNPQVFQEAIEAVIPLKRCARAEEIASFCLFIASEEAKYLTGASLDLDGGEHLKDHFDLVFSYISNEKIKTCETTR